ncbi:MAG: hypothetical protein ACP5KE_02225 [Candidatus Methanodesulfokora sp.]
MRRPRSLLDLISIAKEFQIEIKMPDREYKCNVLVLKEEQVDSTPCWVLQIWNPDLAARATIHISKEDGSPIAGRFALFEYKGEDLMAFYMQTTTPIRIFLQQQDNNIEEWRALGERVGSIEIIGERDVCLGDITVKAFGYRVRTSELARKMLTPVVEGEYWMADIGDFSIVIRSITLFDDGTRIEVGISGVKLRNSDQRSSTE